MFIALLKTNSNQIAIEISDFSQALGALHRMMDKVEGIKKALILETDEYLDDQCPDFDSYKVVVSMGILK